LNVIEPSFSGCVVPFSDGADDKNDDEDEGDDDDDDRPNSDEAS
jgi:hypothetical protein